MLGVIVLLLLGAAYTSVLIVRRQSELAGVSRYNITWLVSQAGLEVSRLYGTVAASLLPDSIVDEDEVDLRLAIVENRVKLLEGGDIAEFLATSPDLKEIVANVALTVEQARRELGDLNDPNRSKRLMQLTSSLNAPIARLAAAANTFSADKEARDRSNLDKLHWVFAAILGTIITLGLGLVAAMNWHNRLLALAQEQAQRQNVALQARDAELQTRSERFDAALNNMSQALCMIDADGRLIVCNIRFLDLFGLRPEDADPGRTATEIFAAIGIRDAYPASMVAAMFANHARIAEGRVSAGFMAEDDAGQALAVSQEPLPDGGWVATFEDVTERRRTEAKIHHMAHHDSLTGLPNRMSFQCRLVDALERHGVASEEVALLCLDLDQFKEVNDVHGHPFGDRLLTTVAERLVRCIREGDAVARLGGDEFAILQVGAPQPAAATAIARRIVQELGEPYQVEGQRVVIGVSAGVALAGPDQTAEELLKNADIALYRAKADGRNTYRLFEAEMGTQVRLRREMEADLRDACKNRDFRVFYQPLYNLGTDRVCGFEALVRWFHPEKGMISPATFIPIAEETGLISVIGEWVLAQACADAAAWPGGLKVAVNLSPIQFSQPELVATVRDTLAETGLDPARLELEITESALLQNSKSVLALLHDLRGLGSRLVLDDFGTGFSSLSYLHAFPFSKVKIDRSFVKDMTTQPHCEAIVRAVTNLAACLGMTTTAEGVETQEQLDRLRQAGCTEAQGFLIARPQPVDELRRWLVQEPQPEPQLTCMVPPGALPRRREPGEAVHR